LIIGAPSCSIRRSPIKEIAEIIKEAKTAKQAWKETYFLGSLLPKTARMNVLKAGINGMSQKISVILSLH